MSEKRFCDQPSYFGFANELSPNDERLTQLEKEFEEFGVDGTYTWSADYTIAKFILKVLTQYQNNLCGNPSYLESQEEWEDTITKMMEGFDLYVNQDDLTYTPESDKLVGEKIERSLELFKTHFCNLWT
jgi:hypothetical protein